MMANFLSKSNLKTEVDFDLETSADAFIAEAEIVQKRAIFDDGIQLRKSEGSLILSNCLVSLVSCWSSSEKKSELFYAYGGVKLQ